MHCAHYYVCPFHCPLLSAHYNKGYCKELMHYE